MLAATIHKRKCMQPARRRKPATLNDRRPLKLIKHREQVLSVSR